MRAAPNLRVYYVVADFGFDRLELYGPYSRRKANLVCDEVDGIAIVKLIDGYIPPSE